MGLLRFLTYVRVCGRNVVRSDHVSEYRWRAMKRWLARRQEAGDLEAAVEDTWRCYGD